MEVIFASETEAEVRIYPGEGLVHTFCVSLQDANVRRYLRKIAGRNEHKCRMYEPIERVPRDTFLAARRLAVEAVENERRGESCKIKVTHVNLEGREVKVSLSWPTGSSLITFGAGRQNRVFLKTHSNGEIPERYFGKVRSAAEEAFAQAFVDDKMSAHQLKRALAR